LKLKAKLRHEKATAKAAKKTPAQKVSSLAKQAAAEASATKRAASTAVAAAKTAKKVAEQMKSKTTAEVSATTNAALRAVAAANTAKALSEDMKKHVSTSANVAAAKAASKPEQVHAGKVEKVNQKLKLPHKGLHKNQTQVKKYPYLSKKSYVKKMEQVVKQEKMRFKKVANHLQTQALSGFPGVGVGDSGVLSGS